MSTGTELQAVMKTPPKRYQIQGVRFLRQTGGRALLGDDMGLGKSYQALGWMALHPGAVPVVIVCPSNAKWNWVDQILLHTRIPAEDIEVLEGRKPRNTGRPILILNYDIIAYWEKEILRRKPRLFIIDESQKIKTRRIARTKACARIGKKTKHVIGISGTPLINRPAEFFPILNILRPAEYTTWWDYAMRYCGPRIGWGGTWDFSGASNCDELHDRLKSVMIRRMKTEVLKELPPKQRVMIHLSISNYREYIQARDNFLEWYGAKKGDKAAEKAAQAEALVRLGALKRVAAEGKLSQAVEWIEDFLESGEKLVVFCHHQHVFQALKKAFPKSAFGGGPDRFQQVQKFQQEPTCRTFIGTIQADGQAVTLTAASTVLFLELGWTPGEHDQAEDRIYRIGQTASSVTAYYLIAKDTVDEYVWELIEKKRAVVQKVLDGTDSGGVGIGSIVQLLRKERKK